MKSILLITTAAITFLIFLNCSNQGSLETVHFRYSSEGTINLKNKIIDIPLELYFSFGTFNIIDSLLIIYEAIPRGEKVIHVLNSNNFKHLTSFGKPGRGPGELTPMAGNLFINNISNTIMVNDFGKFLIYEFPIDSILNNDEYISHQTIEMAQDIFLDNGFYINDSIIQGAAIVPISINEANKRNVRYNINSNTIDYFGHERLNIESSDSFGRVYLSLKHNKYIRSYPNLGLIDICDIQGNHLLTIEDVDAKSTHHESFSRIQFYEAYIISSYLGDYSNLMSNDSNMEVLAPDKFIIFNSDGSHYKTLELGNKFSNWVADEQNQRLVIYFNDREHLLGYIDLSKILP